MTFVCKSKQLPDGQHVEAAKAAVKINPANAPVTGGSHDARQMALLPPERLALLTSKYWGAAGVSLSVQFLDDPSQALRTKLLSHMNAWGQQCNVKFAETSGQGQVRINRNKGDGYWSYLGTDILQVPAGQNTMNLDSFTESTPDSEFFRVVRHETGHTLGFPHEHERAEIIALLDPQKTIAYFQQNYGWDEQTTTEQVLTPLAAADLVATPQADQRSIMCYDFSGDCTKDGQPIPGGTDINEQDFAFAAKLYPQSVGGGGGGGGGGGPAGAKLFSVTFGKAVAKGKKVSFPAPVAIPAGAYDVVRQVGSDFAAAPGQRINWSALLTRVEHLLQILGPAAAPAIQALLDNIPNLPPFIKAAIDALVGQYAGSGGAPTVSV